MRAFDRDLIRGGHYGQRSCETAPTGRTHGCTDQQRDVKISLANSGPSTHGTSRHFAAAQQFGRIWSEADINHRAGFMSTRLSSSPAHLPLPNALAQ
jgi:hypothetical protein